MSKGNNNNSAGRRPHGQQPYDPNNSFVKKMATKMGEMIPQKSWISKWFNSPGANGEIMLNQSSSDDQEILEETMLQPPTKRPRIRMDVTHPPGTFAIQPRNRQVRNQDEDDMSDEFHDTTTAGPSSSRSFLSSTPANPQISSKPILIPHSKSNGTTTTINGTDGNSESGESTSGCSSLIPQMSHQDSTDRQNYINLPFGTRKNIIDNKLNSFTNNLQSPRSLFLDSIKRDSMSSRRPSFSLTMLNNNNNNNTSNNNNINNDSTSTSELDTNSVLSSPFYTGNTMFGGANAVERSRKNLASVPGVSQFQLKIPRKSSIQVKPSNVTTDSSGMSQTAKRIFEALENFSSPISDAKKIPVKTSYSKKRGRDEAFDVTSPPSLSTTTTTRVGLRHLTRELAVPTVPDMLKLKRRQRLQDTTLAARKLISANSTPLSSSSSSSSSGPSGVVNQEYHLKTSDNDSSKFLTKLRARPMKVTGNNSNSSSCQPIEQVNLPNISLPITSLPTFDIALPKSSSNTKLPVANSDNDNIPSKPKISKIETIKSPQTSKVDDNYEFSSPIRLENNLRKSLQSINDFTFSKPINPEVQENNKSSPAASVSSMNFVWSGSSTAPRPKTNQVDKTSKNTTTTELKSGSVMDILGNNSFENQGNLWECNECLIKNNENVDNCIACKMSKEKSSSMSKKSSMENILQSSSSSVNETMKFGDKYKIKNNNENSVTETKDETTKNNNKSTVSKLDNQADTVFGKGKIVDSTLDKFKPAKDSWECPGCMLRNPEGVIVCPCCNASKPGLMKVTPNKSNETCDDISKKQQSNEESSSSSSSKLSNSLSSSGFGDKFKKPAGSWSCDVCMVQNKSEVTECVACCGLKPGAKPVVKSTASDSAPKFSFGIPAAAAASTTTESGFGDKFKKPAGSWSCDVCMVQNKSEVTECIACGGLKPGAKPSAKPAESIPKFTFGIPSVSSMNSSGESNKTESPANGFTFGVPASTGSKTNQQFTFGIPSATTTAAAAPTTTTESSGFTFAAPKKLDNFKNDDKTSANTPAQQPTGFTFNTPTEIKKVDDEKQKEKSIPQVFGDVTKPETTTTTTTLSSSTLQEKKESNNVLVFGQSTLPSATTNEQKNSSDGVLESGEKTKKASFSFGSGSTSSVIFGGDKTSLEAAKPSPVVSFGSTPSSASPISFGADNNKLPSFGTISKVTNASVSKDDDKSLFKAPAVTFGSQEKPAVTTAAATTTTTPSSFGSWPSSSTPLFGSSSTENTSTTQLTTQSGTSSTNIFGNSSSTEQKIKAPTPTPGLFTFGSTASQQNKQASSSTTGFQFNSQPATASSSFGTFGSSVQSQSSNNFSFGNTATSNPPAAASTTPSFSFNFTGTGGGSTPVTASQPEQKLSSNNSAGFSGFGGFSSTGINPATPSFSFNAPPKPSATPSFGQSSSVQNVFGNSQQTPTGSFSNLAPSNSSGFNFNSTTPAVPSATSAGGFNFSAAAPNPAAASGGFNFNPPPTAPAQPVAFDPTSRPSFNFTGGSAPTAFTASPQAATPAGPRKIKRAVRRIQPRT